MRRETKRVDFSAAAAEDPGSWGGFTLTEI